MYSIQLETWRTPIGKWLTYRRLRTLGRHRSAWVEYELAGSMRYKTAQCCEMEIYIIVYRFRHKAFFILYARALDMVVAHVHWLSVLPRQHSNTVTGLGYGVRVQMMILTLATAFTKSNGPREYSSQG